MQVLLIKEISNDCQPEKLLSTERNKKHIKSLKSNKAPAIDGLTADHLKFGLAVVVEAVTQVINNTFRSGKIPPQFKLGH